MSVSNKNLRPGDVLRTETNEVYIYLGYYAGRARSIYPVTDEGYFYMFVESMFYFTINKKDPLDLRMHENNILTRSRCMFDGNAAWTRHYKRFAEKLGHVDIDVTAPHVASLYGLTRLGDKKPGGASAAC